jgi:hypothetical protein
VDGGAWVVGRFPNGKGALQIAVGGDDERQHVAEVEGEPPSDGP